MMTGRRCYVIPGEKDKFGGHIGKFLRREGVDSTISAKLYRAVVQAVLLFGAKTWVLMAEMLNKLDGVHLGFLRQVTGMKE